MLKGTISKLKIVGVAVIDRHDAIDVGQRMANRSRNHFWGKEGEKHDRHPKGSGIERLRLRTDTHGRSNGVWRDSGHLVAARAGPTEAGAAGGPVDSAGDSAVRPNRSDQCRTGRPSTVRRYGGERGGALAATR